jgi:hypothetical protein
MAASDHDPDRQRLMAELLTTGIEAEQRLLREERKAEKRLAEAIESLANDEARLLRAQQRLERSRAAVAAAESSLREAQKRRAAGPVPNQV